MTNNIVLWVGFNIAIVILLVVDLWVFQRKPHEISLREGVIWSLFWIGLSLAFNVVIYYWMGPVKGLEFLTGYLIEKSLSADNLFVFIVIFSYFNVPAQYQHKVLFWGILGAMIMRAIFIFSGIALISRFGWIIYVFGAFLIFTGIRLLFDKGEKVHPEKNPIIRLLKRLGLTTDSYHGSSFTVRENGRLRFTPLFLVLMIIETTDVVFAVDSIPAILGITLDPFIVYSSNMFAILGLRALYFVLASIMKLFYYLKYGLSLILIFVGVKMLLEHFYEIPVTISLAVVAAILFLSITISLLWPPAHVEGEDKVER